MTFHSLGVLGHVMTSSLYSSTKAPQTSFTITDIVFSDTNYTYTNYTYTLWSNCHRRPGVAK